MRVNFSLSKFAVLGTACLSLAACSLDNLVKVSNPDLGQGQVIDPSKVTTYSGAVGMYYAAYASMAKTMSTASEYVALFTDEMTYTLTANNSDAYIDARYDQNGNGISPSQLYESIQAARVQAEQASEVLLKYGTAASYPMVGNAYAMQGYAELLLAELYCSGVPLTTVPFGNDFQYTAGLSTQQVLQQAIAHFDTAYSYGKDSVPVATFALVSKGRALLDLGEYQAAAEAVADVPTSSTVTIGYSSTATGAPRFWTYDNSALGYPAYRILNNEGINGEAWVAVAPAKQDPRLPISSTTDPIREQKYLTTGSVILPIANGIQARLIEAEAALQAGDTTTWLSDLNTLRTNGTYSVNGIDTTWNAGTGGVAGLRPLTDPGADSSRVNLMFKERAFWLYLDGTRLGDLRRLVREYHRPSFMVYPTGQYQGSNVSIVTYGSEVVFVPPKSEVQNNPDYQGCIDRNA